ETTKQLSIFNGHKYYVMSVKYGSGMTCGSRHTILSGSHDKSVRLWDIRSGQQTQVFNGHIDTVMCVEYSPFAIKNASDVISSNVVCSGSLDNTIRFWDVRSNKSELYLIKGDGKEEGRVYCLKFVSLKKKVSDNEQNLNDECGIYLYYGLHNGSICVWE
ncbi:hypothetical protein RFI_34210, partial [Reticulomyxa filosa]